MSDDVIDLNEFLERVQEDKELLVELLDIFMEDYGEKRVLLEDALSNSNYEEVKNIAHSLKGASGNISAKPLREIFLQLEAMGDKKDFSAWKELLSDLDQRFESLTSRIGQLKIQLAA